MLRAVRQKSIHVAPIRTQVMNKGGADPQVYPKRSQFQVISPDFCTGSFIVGLHTLHLPTSNNRRRFVMPIQVAIPSQQVTSQIHAQSQASISLRTFK